MGSGWLTVDFRQLCHFPRDPTNFMVGVLDTGDVGVLGKADDEVRVHLYARAHGGVRVDDDWERCPIRHLDRQPAVLLSARVRASISPLQRTTGWQQESSCPESTMEGGSR